MIRNERGTKSADETYSSCDRSVNGNDSLPGVRVVADDAGDQIVIAGSNDRVSVAILTPTDVDPGELWDGIEDVTNELEHLLEVHPGTGFNAHFCNHKGRGTSADGGRDDR